MSEPPHATGHGSSHAAPRRFVRPMRARDPKEPHRASTPLELLFDLCFVVAVAQAASHLHHGLAEGHGAHALLNYGLVFFALWWAWMNFTWFASAYDTDDGPYRLKVLVQIAGSLVIAAGIPRAFEGRDYSVVTVGYAIMRVAQIAHWIRAASADPATRTTAIRYGIGLTVCQLLWFALLLVPHDLWIYGWFLAAPLEMAVPIWAERRGETTWHPGHIAERYGLLTLIVLGESVAAATLATQAALDSGHAPAELMAEIVGGLLLVFSMWWVYFDEPAHALLTSTRVAFVWGYGHLFVFASVAAVGAGLALSTDALLDHTHIPHWQVAAAIAVPVATYLTMVWFLQIRPLVRKPIVSVAFLTTAALVLATIAAPWPVLLIGILLSVLVGVLALSKR